MAEITKNDVLKLAKLSMIELSDAEVSEFSKELSEILNLVNQLAEVETKDLQPTIQVTGLTNVNRPDEIIDYGVTTADLLKNVPQVEDNQIKVKRVLN